MNWNDGEKLRIMLADDHPMFREGLTASLGSVPEFEVVGEASGGEEAVRLAQQLQPDIILMDINMPGKNGIEATRDIVWHSPHIGILILTMFDDDASVFSAMRAGARGYLLKGANKQEIVRALQAVGSGEAIFSASIARRMMFYFDALTNKPAEPLFPELSDREREVLEWIAKGHDNAFIARKLGLSLKTVRNHVSNILNKLQVVDRAQAILMAREAGLGQP
ncbi:MULTISPECIES: response regulator [Cohnella]|uniref:response regulator n=1 Tax=Cohnella TaxID=329857 RepID=UPI0015942586|nr:MULTISPECIES: response regulator transcription factor [Cohnella]MBN2980407.1 response regulator transcription factor [Cohnella algarum]